MNPLATCARKHSRQLSISGPNRKPTRTLFRCRRLPGDATSPLAGQGNQALAALFTSTGRTLLSMTALRLSSCGVSYAFPPSGGERKAPNTLTRRI